jgi:hypothetical protein
MLIEVVSMAGGRGEGFSFGIVLEPDCERERELDLELELDLKLDGELELGLEFVVQSALGAGATCCSRRAVGRNRAWAAYTHIQRPEGDGKVSRRWCLHWQERGRRCGDILDRIS